MRINKFIAESGKASRRGADRLVEEKKVKINKRVAKVGDTVKPGDRVLVNGEEIIMANNYVYIALNKPVGITSTSEKGAGNVVDFVGHPLRISHVGRLDKDSEGLLLLTNDGDIVNRILRAENNHEKEYIVGVDRPIHPDFIEAMSKGVKIKIPQGNRVIVEKTLPCEIKQIDKYTFSIVLIQGLNRQIRRMCEELGYHVYSLKRTRIMNIELGNLPMGQWRDLTKKEKNRLFADLDYEPKNW